MTRALLQRGAGAVFAAFVLSACVPTQYQAMDEAGWGYQERKLEDGSYVLIVKHPNDGPAARTYWERRAGELCEGKPYKKNIFRADRPTIRYDSYGGMPGWYEVEGYVTCGAS